LAYTKLLAEEKAAPSNWLLIRAAAGWVKRHGVTINRRVMTDNGSDYRSHLLLTPSHRLGTKPVKTKLYTPHPTGKTEQFIQTSLKGWAYKQAYKSSAEREATLLPWLLHDYNHRKPHAPVNNRLLKL
jgi:transposase InsO family protein